MPDYEALLGSIGAVVWEAGPSRSRFRYVSPSAERLLGHPLSAWTGDEGFFLRHLHPEDRDRVIDLCRCATRERRDHELEYRLLAADGGAVWVRDIVSVVGKREPMALRGVMVDVSERVCAEEERRRSDAREQAARRLESLGILSGGVAHDFNNLLTTILGGAELMLGELPRGSRARGSADHIRRAVKEAVALTGQLQACAGTGRVEPRPTDLTQLARDAAEHLPLQVFERGKLERTLAEDLPPVDLDAGLMGRAVCDLVTNAAEALPERGRIALRTGLCELSADEVAQLTWSGGLRAGRHVFLEVADDGAGMDAETRARIFEPFFTTKFAGRGLGLASVLGIVRAHGGGLDVTSKVGKGTSVRVLLPCSERPARAARSEGVGGSSRADEPTWGAGIVLVVDDEDDVREIAAEMARRLGFEVWTARDGLEARTRLEHDARVRAVLLDMTMPTMSGAEAAREIARIAPGMPIVLMSGYSEQYARARAIDSTFAGFLQKPFSPEDLSGVLRAALEGTPPCPAPETV